MNKPQRYPYSTIKAESGEAGLLPFLPLILIQGSKSIEVKGLVDSGSSVNVLPYSIGVSLGLSWEKQKVPINLTGNLAKSQAKAVLIEGKVHNFPTCRLAFAWTKLDNIPLILGQTNFFMEFDVFFFRSKLAFEVVPKS